jgi:hypothetical protein
MINNNLQGLEQSPTPQHTNKTFNPISECRESLRALGGRQVEGASVWLSLLVAGSLGDLDRANLALDPLIIWRESGRASSSGLLP